MNKSRRMLRRLLAAGALVLALAAAPAFGATYTLRAAATALTLPDGTEVPMWGFALVSFDLGAGEVAGDNVVTVGLEPAARAGAAREARCLCIGQAAQRTR